MKNLVVLLDAAIVDYSVKINEYADRIRETEPKYKTPLEERQRAQLIKTIIIIIVIGGVILFCVYLCKRLI